MTARLDILAVGSAGERVASTVVLVRDGDVTIVVDPGMVADREQLTQAVRELGADPASVTDIVLSHHHPDHTINIAVFPPARVHDHWAIYDRDTWTSRPAEGYQISPSVRLMATPGHTPEDISTVVETDEGLVVCTHLWWTADGPEVDPLAHDQAALEASRARVLELGPVRIVPGHGAPFTP